jgi:hypothetical protein
MSNTSNVDFTRLPPRRNDCERAGRLLRQYRKFPSGTPLVACGIDPYDSRPAEGRVFLPCRRLYAFTLFIIMT